MADRTQRKIADPNDIAADDPFGELTRIMGFDPREPVSPRDAPAAASAQEATDDFDIDLEKELMGEFAGFDEPAPPVVHEEPAAAMPDLAVAASEPHDGAQSEIDDHLEAALEADFRFEDGFSAEAGMQAAPVQALEVPEVEIAEHGFDDAVARAFEGEPRFQSDPVLQLDAAPAEAVQPGHDHEAQADDHFEAHFDRAMADLATEFDASGTETAPPPETGQTDEPAPEVAAAPEAEAFAAPVPAAVGQGNLEDELNALLNRMNIRPVVPDPAGDEWAREEADASAGMAVAEDAATADELDWQAEAAASAEAAETHSVAEPVDEPAAPQEFYAGPDEPLYDEPVFAGQGDVAGDDIHFDEDDFDVAMAGEAAVQEPPAAFATGQDPAGSPQWPPQTSHVWGRGTPVAPPRPAEQATPAPQPVAEETPYTPHPVHDAVQVEVPPAPVAYEADEYAAQEPAGETPPASTYDDVPDIETIDVPERVAALPDDLDIPELAFEEDRAEAPAYDDLDAEFASLLHEMNAADAAPAPSRADAYDDDAYAAGFASHQADQRAYADFGPAVASSAAVAAIAQAGGAGAGAAEGPELADSQPPAEAVDPFAVAADLDYDPDQEETMVPAGLAAMQAERSSRRRGFMIAGLIGAVAVAGGLGAFALSFGGSGGSDAPAIVKADNNPIKVKPENPGGTVIPNQDSKVYETVANGAKPVAPTQEKLIADAEEPVDVTAQQPPSRVVDVSGQDAQEGAADAAPAPVAKAEDRIEPTAQDDVATAGREVPVVVPRKVRTMVVKPDGSLVPREEPEPVQVAAAEPTDPAPQQVLAPEAQDATGAVSAGGEGAATRPAAQSATPAVAPVAPQRPSDQPVNVVGEVKPDQVASIGSGATAGAWSMQIASQPTAESAQATYQDLARRYAGVLDGHKANIVKADVAGKGTFYRVRVPTQSRDEAIALCTSYKAAGGNCFVSK